MATAALMAASLAVSAIQTSQQNRALERQQEAADLAAQRRVDELRRQQERADMVAQEEKSDVARESDQHIGRLIAAAADGGQTVAGLARLTGAVAGVRGLDIARIESNRVEDGMARRAESVSIIEENAAQRDQTRSKIRSNTIGFFGNAIGMGLKYGSTAGPGGDAGSNSVSSTHVPSIATDARGNR